jgi:hypothetical protein
VNGETYSKTKRELIEISIDDLWEKRLICSSGYVEMNEWMKINY